MSGNVSAIAGSLGGGIPGNLGGGGLDGADRLSRETALWNPVLGSPDQIINRAKDTADARSQDTVRNSGYAAGATNIHKDSIVGAQFRLNAAPKWQVLQTISKGFDDAWAEEYQEVIEARFNVLGDSSNCWLDASRMNTFTGMIRLAIGVFLATGEVISTCEWIRESDRPYNTALQFVRSTRLCNPNGQMDRRDLRRGVAMDARGKPLGYWFRKGERYDMYPDDYSQIWTYVPVAKPWGRKQVIHIIEQQDYGQSRGVSEMVAVLKNMRMTRKFQDIVLQSAVINATYAAAIESELPGEAIVAAMGGGNSVNPGDGMMGLYGAYMNGLMRFLGGANGIAVDGAKVPHLFPGTKLNTKSVATPGGVGTGFEESLLRHTAAGLNLSYESLSRDFSKTNYSSGKLAMGVQNQAMNSRKRHVADRLAGEIYALVTEEMMSDGDLPLPAGVRRDVFYKPLAKEAFCTATWIGSGSGQVDELKETQAAILRIRSGLSTHENESARLGFDWREIARQRARELKLFGELSLQVDYITQKPTDKPTDTEADDPSGDDVQEVEGSPTP